MTLVLVSLYILQVFIYQQRRSQTKCCNVICKQLIISPEGQKKYLRVHLPSLVSVLPFLLLATAILSFCAKALS